MSVSQIFLASQEHEDHVRARQMTLLLLLLGGAKAALLAGVHRPVLTTTGRLQDTAVVMKVGSMPRSELTKKYDLVVVGGG